MTKNMKYFLATLGLACAFSAHAVPFTQTLTGVEADDDLDGVTDPFVFEFSGLPALTGTSFDLDLVFDGLDLTGGGFEFLATAVDSFGTSYSLGEFPITVTGADAFEAAGFGSLSVLFADVGGLLSDPFSVILTPSSDVNPYGVLSYSGTCIPCGDFIGFAELTFSAEAAASVPEPAMLALFGIGLAGFGVARRRA